MAENNSYVIVPSGKGRAFVLRPDGTLLGCVERTSDYSWGAQTARSVEYDAGKYWPSRKKAVMALIRKSTASTAGVAHVGA